MDIAVIDRNFAKSKIKETGIVWKNAKEPPFETRGVFYDEGEGCYRRMPKDRSSKINWGIDWMARATAGGRIRFITDSPYVAIKAVASEMSYSANGTLIGRGGISVYQDGVFCGYAAPYPEDVAASEDGKMAFDGIAYAQGEGVWQAELYLPLYNDVLYDLYIGVKSGAFVQAPKPYSYDDKPIVFYGSSITQGGCASRAGNDYTALVSRWLCSDYVNLGFSGGAKGESEMAEYLASLSASAFVIDYDANAPSAEWLKKTHYPMYETIRRANPKTPIVFMTYPAIRHKTALRAPTREVIRQNYLAAKKGGDERVFFIDGETLFGEEDWDCCTGDRCHPNDLGFYRMAKTLLPVLRQCLTIENE